MPQIESHRMFETPKYALLEIERRWLVDPSELDLRPLTYQQIDDLYISESHLRLRRISGPKDVVFKLGKKYGKRTPLTEPITNLYLTEGEYLRLASLPGARACKRRYSVSGGSLDVYLEPADDLAIFEVEFPDEPSAQRFVPPSFVIREIANEATLSGVALAQRTARA